MVNKKFYGSGNDDFICENCSKYVPKLTSGSYRNHCPYCLYSKHVDESPGARDAFCKALMKPEKVEYSGKKGWMIVHHCTDCNKIIRNKAALSDIIPDDYDTLVRIANHTI